MDQGKLEFCKKRTSEKEMINMVNCNPPSQKAIKPLTILQKDEPKSRSEKDHPSNDTGNGNYIFV